MRFSAIDDAPGCVYTTRPSGPMLKLDQFRTALFELCCTFIVLPVTDAPARPDVTKPVTPAPHVPAVHGVGNSAPRATAPVSAAATARATRDFIGSPRGTHAEQQSRVAGERARR